MSTQLSGRFPSLSAWACALCTLFVSGIDVARSAITGANSPIVAPVVSGRTFSGVFREAIPGRTTQIALDLPEAEFFATTNSLASRGFHLIDLDVKPVTGSNLPRWSGVYESGAGIGGTQLWVLSKNDLQTKTNTLRAQGYDIVDLETYRQESTATHWYVGLFRRGTGTRILSLGMDSWDELNDLAVLLRQPSYNYHLANLEHHEENGIDVFAAVWSKGASGTEVSEAALAGWNQLSDDIQTKAGRGLRLIDMEATNWHMNRSGVSVHERGYLGTWIRGTADFEVVAATTKTVFLRKESELRSRGLQPIRIEMEQGFMPPVGLAATFAREMDGRVTGYSYAVAETGSVTARGGFGYARPLGTNHTSGPRMMSADTRFDIASVSKSLLAAAVLRLRDQGAFGAEGIDQSFLRGPYLNGATLGNATNIGDRMDTVTIRDLLRMRSGVSFGDCSVANWYTQYVATDIPANAPPGTVNVYNNADSCVLRRVVEAASGQPFAQYLQEQVLGPMGISATNGVSCVATSPAFEVQYFLADQTSGNGVTAQSASLYDRVCGAGGLHASADQVLRFLMGLRTTSVLTQASLDEMVNQVMHGAGMLPSRLGQYYAKNGGAQWWQGSVTGGTSAVIGMAPQDTQIAILSNATLPGGDFITTTLYRGVLDMQTMPLAGFQFKSVTTGKCMTVATDPVTGAPRAALLTCAGPQTSAQLFMQRKRRGEQPGDAVLSQFQAGFGGLCLSSSRGLLYGCDQLGQAIEFRISAPNANGQVRLMRANQNVCVIPAGDTLDQATCNNAAQEFWTMTPLAPF